MSKAKSKSERIEPESTVTDPEPTQATPEISPSVAPAAQARAAPAPSHGWKFDAMASGVEKLLATMFFRRLPSAVPPVTGFARREELLAQLEDFKTKHPAALRLKELNDRWTKVQAELDAAVEKHATAQLAFVDDPAKAEELEAVYGTILRLSSQSDALATTIVTARTNAQTAYRVFQRDYDNARQERLKVDCASIAEKIESLIAPLLNEFGAARDLLRQERGLLWPDFGNVFPSEQPAPKTDNEPLPQFNLGVGGSVPLVADNRMNLPWHDRRPDPNWGREHPPIKPAMQPVTPAEQSE